jgi:hypothetical protein
MCGGNILLTCPTATSKASSLPVSRAKPKKRKALPRPAVR